MHILVLLLDTRNAIHIITFSEFSLAKLTPMQYAVDALKSINDAEYIIRSHSN